MSASAAAIITTNIHRKLMAVAAESNSTKTTNPIIIATSSGTGLTKPSSAVKEWGALSHKTPLFKTSTK